MKTWVIINDLQIPFEDRPVVDLVLDFIEDLRPHGVVLNGDIVDAYDLSEFSHDPLKRDDLRVEIQRAGALMARLAKVTKERVWVGGNHEDRLRRYLWKAAPALGVLSDVQFPALFKLADYGFAWREYGDFVRLGKLLVTHGSMVAQHSGVSAKRHFEKYGTSVLIGHTHRLGIYYRSTLSGVHAAYENGCLCRLDPEYIQHPDWQQGFAVVHVDDRGGWFHVQQLAVLHRRLFLYGAARWERRRVA